MAVSGIGIQTSNLQILRAQNAFQNNIKTNEEVQKCPQGFDEEDVKISISSKNLTINDKSQVMEQVQNGKNGYISEIKEFANKCNITDVEEDDIQQALRYGTSLFVDHTA